MPDNDGGVKLGVEGLGQFTRDLQAASKAVGALGSASKLADSELRKTGDTSAYVQQKTAALTRQIEAQERAVEAAERGLRAAAAAYGENSRQAQDWAAKLNNQKAALNNLQANLNQVASGTDKLQSGLKNSANAAKDHASVVNGIKYQTFMSAMDRVEGKLKSMAQTAKRAGQEIWSSATGSSDWADTLITDASRYGMDTKTLQQWQYAARFVDTEVATIAQAMNKTRSGMTGSSKAAAEALKELGVTARGSGDSMADVQDTFWRAIDALGRMQDEVARDDAAQQLFGKSFADLKPLIDSGRDSWEAYCNEAERAGHVLTDEQVQKLGSFNDSLQRMDSGFQALKNGFMAELAPGFESISDALGDLTGSLLEWAQSAEGKDTLGKFTDGIRDFVQDLASGGAVDLINGITDALKRLGDAAKWVGDHADTIATVAKIGAGIWVGGKVAGGVGKGVATVKAIGGALGIGGQAAAGAAAGGTAATGGVTAVLQGIPAAVGKGVASALTSSAGAGAIGFTGGIGAVLGVGLLAKALAGEGALSDFGGAKDSAEYKALQERNRQKQEIADERHQQGIENAARDAAIAVVEAIEALKDSTTDDQKAARKSLSGMTADDIKKAIEGANLNWTGEGGTTSGKVTVETEVKLTGEAVKAALADGKITKHEIEGIKKYIAEHFDPAVKEAVSLIKGGWQAILDQANTPEGTGTPTAPTTEVEVLDFTAMTKWVSETMGKDAAEAKAAAAGLWAELALAAGDPSQMQADFGQSADEAKTSGTNRTWNAMVNWVQKTMGLDLSAAEQMVTQLWTQLGTYATAAKRHPELNGTYQPTGETSTVFQDYVKDLFQDDYEAAKQTLDDWLKDIDKAVENHTPPSETAGDGHAAGTDGSSYLSSKVQELITVKGQIEGICNAITTAIKDGVKVPPETLAELEALMGRAEKLSGEISWYESDAAVTGRGAMGMAMNGQNWQATAPVAIEYAKALREHELTGIDEDIKKKETDAGNAFLDWMKAVGVRDGLKEGTKEYADAVAAVTKAEEKYRKLQKDAEDARTNEETNKAKVEAEYADNIAEIFTGLAKFLGYKGEGKGVVGTTYTIANTAAGNMGWPFNDPSIMAGLSGYAMGGARAWQMPAGADYGTEAGQILLRRQAGMSSLQRQMADALNGKYGGSYEKFMASLGAGERKAMEDILKYKGNAAEGDFWSDIMFSAFGKGPENTYYNAGGNGKLAGVENTATWSAIQKLIDFKPRETAEQAEASRIKEAQAQADAMNAVLKSLAETYNEESGYNSYKDLVKSWADQGMFEGIDWSKIDGGALEDTLADLASEAQAAGEEVGAGYGIGMESSRDKVFNAGDETGGAGIEGLEEGAGVNSPSVYGIEAGQYIDEGLAIGLQSGMGMVADAAREVARQAIEAIRGELDIHSPSKVMEGLGDFTGQGFAQGITDSIGSVSRAVDSVVDATTRPVEAMRGRGASGGNSYSSNAGVYIDRYYQNSGEDVQWIRDQLAGMQQRQLQGFGLRR